MHRSGGRLHYLGLLGLVKRLDFIIVLVVIMVGAVFLLRLALGIWQINNHLLAESVQYDIEAYRVRSGSYPDDLSKVFGKTPRDLWGSRFVYETDGNGYVLISRGWDWKADQEDYWALRGRLASQRAQGGRSNASGWTDHRYVVCGDYAGDEVMTDVGWLQVCGK